MNASTPNNLAGKVGLVTGIANASSIAYACAKAFRAAGAELAITYGRPKTAQYTEPLAKELGAGIFTQLDVQEPGQAESVFEQIDKKWGKLDFLLHSIAFAPKEALHGRVTDCPREGFLAAMDISVYSLMQLTKLAEPLMKNGGAILTMTYLGSQRVVPGYNVMGIAKAGLEAATRYLAAELGPKGIRVHAISPGPIMTRAASGIPGFDSLVSATAGRMPIREPLSTEHVAPLAAFLVGDGAKLLTGSTLYVDGGYNIVG